MLSELHGCERRQRRAKAVTAEPDSESSASQCAYSLSNMVFHPAERPQETAVDAPAVEHRVLEVCIRCDVLELVRLCAPECNDSPFAHWGCDDVPIRTASAERL